MAEISINGVRRTEFGKGASRRARRDGLVPAVIYGHESDVRHVSLPAHELNLALVKPRVVLDVVVEGAETITAAPRQIQRDPLRRIIEHVDLVLLSAAEVREREAEARLIVLAEEAAIEAGLDPMTVAEHAQSAVDSGVSPSKAIDQAIEEVKAIQVAQAEAANAAADAQDAADAAGAAAASASAAESAAPSSDEG